MHVNRTLAVECKQQHGSRQDSEMNTWKGIQTLLNASPAEERSRTLLILISCGLSRPRGSRNARRKVKLKGQSERDIPNAIFSFFYRRQMMIRKADNPCLDCTRIREEGIVIPNAEDLLRLLLLFAVFGPGMLGVFLFAPASC